MVAELGTHGSLLTAFRWRTPVELATNLSPGSLGAGSCLLDHRQVYHFLDLFADSLSDLERRVQVGLAALESGLGDNMAQRRDAADVEKVYHLLGACRGVSAGLTGYARAADSVDWACWREERF